MDPKTPPPPPSPAPPPSPSPAPPPSGASRFLSDLPSRGLFSGATASTNLGSMRVYVCEHDTAPPSAQLIKTDQVNILIRSLLLKKHHHPRSSAAGDSSSSSSSAAASRKRAAEKSGDNGPGKKAAAGDGEALQCLTVERLRIMLREKGLNVKGKKDDLIARLRTANG